MARGTAENFKKDILVYASVRLELVPIQFQRALSSYGQDMDDQRKPWHHSMHYARHGGRWHRLGISMTRMIYDYCLGYRHPGVWSPSSKKEYLKKLKITRYRTIVEAITNASFNSHGIVKLSSHVSTVTLLNLGFI